MTHLDPQILAALNNQLNIEMSAAYNYFAMAAHLELKNLKGFASWMMKQREEELMHAMKIFTFILDRGGAVKFASVPEPRADFGDIQDVFATSLKMESANTKSINDLFELAIARKDYATQSFLKWFIDEQVEEEKIMNEVIGLLELAGNDPSAILTLNRQLGMRGSEGA